MTDRELLELAGKAEGYGHHLYPWNESREVFHWTVGGDEETWNPLTDDGDALRLAVKIGKFPSLLRDKSGVMNGYSKGRRSWDPIIEPFGEDSAGRNPSRYRARRC